MFLRQKTAVKWRRKYILNFRYYSRIIRAEALRLFLRFCLLFFFLERRFNGPVSTKEKRILIIVIGGMGDCLLFDPLFRRLREKWPKAGIDVLTTECFKDMWELLDSIDNLMFFTPDKFKTPWSYASFFRLIYRNNYEIVAEGIAMVPIRGIYPIFTSLVFEASQAPVRIGRKSTGSYALLRPRDLGFIGYEGMSETGIKKKAPENPWLTHIIDPSPPEQRKHHESLQLFEPLGIFCCRKDNEPRLRPNPSLDQYAERRLRSQWPLNNDMVIGFTVETTRRIKSWPIENFLSVLEWGVRDNLKFVMVGLEPQTYASPFNKFPVENLLNLSGKTSLGELISIIRQCDIFLSCDTGPSHIAQACHVPTIVLFGPSNEYEFGPVDRKSHTLILPPDDLKCRPCVLGPCVETKSCVQSITAEVVYQELTRKTRHLRVNSHKPAAAYREFPKVLCNL